MPELTTENSFLTIEEADSILDEIYDSDEWFDLDDDNKARLLIQSSKLLKRVLGDVLADVSEDDLSDMVADQCLFIAKYNNVIEETEQNQIAGVSSRSEGTASISVTSGGCSIKNILSPSVKFLMGKYINPNIKLVRG